ncbi:Syntaxin-7 [Mortierella hygrophila]|uniref:Syntaxin-7 n=1 Tax=Mortierella hygrophila TaxID=979708 RepID=A0A9P6F2T7_9FUNG|nr:Syntaxin-7 [Mortierella hygrophila]
MKNKSPIAHHSRFVDENTRIDTPRPTLTPTTAADAAAAVERIGSPEEDQSVPSTTTTTTTSSTTTTTTVLPRSPQSVLTSFQGGSQSNNYNNRVLGNNNNNQQRQVLSPPTSPPQFSPQSSPLSQQYRGFIRVDNRGPHDSGATSMSATSSSSGVGGPSSVRVPKSSNRIDTYQHEGVSIDIDPSTTQQQQAAASSSSSSSAAVVTTSSVFPTSSSALQEQELDYDLMVRHLSQQIFNISSNIAVLERLVPCLGQRHKDTVEMRAGLHAVLDGTHELVKSAHGLVKVLARYHQPPSIPHSGVGIGIRSQQQRQQQVEMSSWQKKVLMSRRQTHQRLTKDLALVSKDFQVLQREAIEAERCQVAILRRLSSSASMRRLSQRRSDLMDLSSEEIQALGNSQGSSSSRTSHGLSNTSFPGLQVFHHDRELSVQEEALLKELLAMDGELAMQENILQERESEIRKIEVGMVEVLDVMKELGTLVHEQRGGVDFLQDNIMQARGRIQQGHQEIVKASEHQRKYREKMCYLLMIASTVGAIVMLAFVST